MVDGGGLGWTVVSGHCLPRLSAQHLYLLNIVGGFHPKRLKAIELPLYTCLNEIRTRLPGNANQLYCFSSV